MRAAVNRGALGQRESRARLRRDLINGDERSRAIGVDKRALFKQPAGAVAAALVGCDDREGGLSAPIDVQAQALLSSGTDIQWCDTYAELRTLVGGTASASKNVAAVRGSSGSIPYEGGGGIFVWSMDTATPDDGGTLIAASSGRTGCWRRLYDGALNVKWFGAKGDGTNDYSAIAQAITRAKATRSELLFPPGLYGYDTKLDFDGSHDVRLRGLTGTSTYWGGQPSTALIFKGTGSTAISAVGSASFGISHIKVSADLASGTFSGTLLDLEGSALARSTASHSRLLAWPARSSRCRILMAIPSLLALSAAAQWR